MTNKEFLRRVSKLQKEFTELYGYMGLIGISNIHIHVKDIKFHELEKEKLLEHISKKLPEGDEYWHYEAMTPDGIKVIALKYVSEMEDKK